jgi:hypothetical protein
MKNIILTFLILLLSSVLFSQNDTIPKQDTTTYKIIKTDGGILIGQIISQDAREILFLTKGHL